MQNPASRERLAHQLGYAGLIPFVLLAIGCWVVEKSWIGDFIQGQLAYGIAILSFLGGLHWSLALTSNNLSAEQSRKALVWSVIPSLLAWFSTMAGGFGFAVLMAGFIAAYQADRRLFPLYGMPGWMLTLRLRLTIIVVASLLLSVIGANTRG
ncbi:DUF3429 domain-containing protein [Noviherbaspirillum humi]|nr:DUF3429 domain-containing protein [Noviherbaspirillum humi]